MSENSSFRLGIIGLGVAGRRMLAFCSPRVPVLGYDADAFRVNEARRAGYEVADSPAALSACTHWWFSPDVQGDGLAACVRRCAPFVRNGMSVWFVSAECPGYLDEACIPWLEKDTGLVHGRHFEVALLGGDGVGQAPLWLAVAGDSPNSLRLLRRLYGQPCPLVHGLRQGEVLAWLHRAYGVLQHAWRNEVSDFIEAQGLCAAALEPYLPPELCSALRASALPPQPLPLPVGTPLTAAADAQRLASGQRKALRLVAALGRRGVAIQRASILFYGFHPSILPLYDSLESYTYNLFIYDAGADVRLISREYGVTVQTALPAGRFDAIIAARPLPDDEKTLSRSRALLVMM